MKKRLFSDDYARNEWMPNFNVKDMGEGRNLLTSPAGTWAMLSDQELGEVRGVRLRAALFKRLEGEALIITEANAREVFKRYSYWNRNNYKGTSLHIIVITDRCNLKCLYCHASTEPSISSPELDLTPEKAREIVDFIFQSPSEDITIEFQGGEPLLNFEALHTIVDYAKQANRIHKKKLSFSLVSNLTVIEREHCAYLKENSIGISTSLDGFSELHDLQRPFASGTGSFKRLVDALDMMRAEDMPTPGFLVVFTAHTLPYHRRLIDMFIELGLDNLNINFVQPLGRAEENWDSIGIEEEQRLKVYEEMLDYIISKFDEGIFIRERFFDLAVQKLLGNEDVGFVDFKNPCGLAIGQLAYGVDGSVYTCDEGRDFQDYKIGDVVANTYDEIINSAKVHELLKRSMPNYNSCKGCAYRPFCVICPVLNSARNRLDDKGVDDPRCAFSKFILDYAIDKITKQWPLINSYLIATNLKAFER